MTVCVFYLTRHDYDYPPWCREKAMVYYYYIPNIRIRIRIRGSYCTDIRICIRIRGSPSFDICMCIRFRGSSCTDIRIRIRIRGSGNFGIRYISTAYILFSLCCIQCHEVQHMLDIPPTVSEEQLLLFRHCWRHVKHMLDLMTLYATQRKQYVCWSDQSNHRVGTQQEAGSEMRYLA